MNTIIKLLFFIIFTSLLLPSSLFAENKFLNDDDIEGIYMRTETLYGLSGVFIKNVSYLFLKNGDVFKKLRGSPYELDVAESKSSQAKHWGKWKKRGGKINIKWSNGKESSWKKWHETIPAKKGETLNGKYKSADPFGGSRVYNFNTIVFNNKGQFSAVKLKGGNTDWKAIISKSEQQGTYTLDRYSITFKKPGKEDETFLFFFYPDSHQHFAIGRSNFVPLKK
jgi:hypothetical protein